MPGIWSNPHLCARFRQDPVVRRTVTSGGPLHARSGLAWRPRACRLSLPCTLTFFRPKRNRRHFISKRSVVPSSPFAQRQKKRKFHFYSPTPYKVCQSPGLRSQVLRGPFLTSPLGASFDPQGRSCPPRGEVIPWGVKFSVRPSILLNSRECSPLGVNEGVNIPSKGQSSP
jgi:hypothetical protein